MNVRGFIKASPEEDRCGFCGCRALGEINEVYGFVNRYMVCSNEKCFQSGYNGTVFVDVYWKGSENDND